MSIPDKQGYSPSSLHEQMLRERVSSGVKSIYAPTPAWYVASLWRCGEVAVNEGGDGTCVGCPVGGTFGGLLVISGSVVECCCATKAMIRCRIAVRAMALAAKNFSGGGWKLVIAVEGVCPGGFD